MGKVSSAIGVLGGKDIDRPRMPTPLPPPPPPREDPQIAQAQVEARRRQEAGERRRRGRKAAILSTGRGVEEPLGPIERPQARAATLLGGT